MRIVFVCALLLTAGCFNNNRLALFGPIDDPIKEFVLEGNPKKIEPKVAVITIEGVITDVASRGFLGAGGMRNAVADTIAALRRAEADPRVKAVVLRLNTPGGTVTASDVLFEEIRRFRTRSGKPVIAAMMDVCASGGLYAAAAADRITAHPTTITGSIGVVLTSVNFAGTLEKIGARDQSIASGPYKTIGSPLKPRTPEEEAILKAIVKGLFDRFVDRLDEGRGNLDRAAVEKLADGRIFTAQQALDAGLIDRIGYLSDAVGEARAKAGVTEAVVVAYRRSPIDDDNLYAGPGVQGPSGNPAADAARALGVVLPSGFQYLWTGGLP